jgi:hypothetical protein
MKNARHESGRHFLGRQYRFWGGGSRHIFFVRFVYSEKSSLESYLKDMKNGLIRFSTKNKLNGIFYIQPIYPFKRHTQK